MKSSLLLLPSPPPLELLIATLRQLYGTTNFDEDQSSPELFALTGPPTMGQVEFTPLVNHCDWKMLRHDGELQRRKIFDCHSVACKWSVDYGKRRCECQ